MTRIEKLNIASELIEEYNRSQKESSDHISFTDWIRNKYKEYEVNKPKDYHYEVHDGFEMSGLANNIIDAITAVKKWVLDTERYRGSATTESIIIERKDIYEDRIRDNNK